LSFPALQVAHATSTRRGGFSEPPYDSLNLGLMSGDDLRVVQRNRDRFAELVGFPIRQNLQMTHGIEVVHLQTPEQAQQPQGGDALITSHPAISLTITTADCVPIFFYDSEAAAIGLAHAGWRGTVNGIAGATVQAMAQQLGCRPERIRAALGPSIGPCCFEVDEDVQRPFAQRFGDVDWIQAEGQKWRIDLHAANRQVLLENGLDSSQIYDCGLCTSCEKELFYSYRRDRGRTGRLLSAISLSGRGTGLGVGT
jgi:polyphenol oxidase